MRPIISLALLALLSGCATIVNGTSQSVAISTTPAGAHCDVARQGSHIGTVAPTPGSLHLDKSKNDIDVSCTKDGFEPATIAQSASFGGATFGNILFGGIIGASIDAASGANYSYPNMVHFDLVPVALPAPTPVAVLPTASVVRVKM